MNPRRVAQTEQAEADVETAVDHYLSQGATEAAMGYVNALEKAVTLISWCLHVGPACIAVHHFPFVVFYTAPADNSGATEFCIAHATSLLDS